MFCSQKKKKKMYLNLSKKLTELGLHFKFIPFFHISNKQVTILWIFSTVFFMDQKNTGRLCCFLPSLERRKKSALLDLFLSSPRNRQVLLQEIHVEVSPAASKCQVVSKMTCISCFHVMPCMWCDGRMKAVPAENSRGSLLSLLN